MPNQMIALQARGPQLPDLSRQTAQMANMMNMARQTEAAQRQAQQAQQAMTINAAQEARAAALHGPALTKAQQDNIIQALTIFREGVADVAEGDIGAAEAVRADLIARVPGWDRVIPPATSWDRNTRYRLMVDAEKEIDKTFATPVASVAVNDRTGQTSSVTAGGFDPRAEVIGEVAPQSATPAAPRATPTAGAGPVPTGKFGETLVVPPESIPLTPYQQEHIREMQSGLGMSQPASFARGAGAGQITPEVAQQIVDTAVKTGLMAQADFDQLMTLAPDQNKQPFMDMLNANNITLQPGGMGQQPQFAVFRGPTPQSRTASLGDAPEMQITRAQSQGRTPFISRREAPLPGSAQVDPAILAAQEAAKAQATENVRLQMAPKIAGATKTAERAVERKPEALVAKNETKAAIQSLDKYIEEIDALLRSADRRFIVGRFEGRIPYVLQDERQSELQAMYDRVKNANTLGALVEGKQASPSGGSPVGPASNLDVQLVAKSASSLTQTGGVAKFDEDLKKLRREAYRTRQRRIEFYSDRYGDLVSEDPKFKLNVRPIADRYISSKDLPKNKTPVIRTLTPDQVRAAPSGTVYMTTDGRKGTKP